jgi:catechol 1,2-dioxygenase/hydroxyquinol 1,2-dioxygenase
VFAVKESLIKPFTTNADPEAAAALGVAAPFVQGVIDIVLHPETRPQEDTNETVKEIVR